VSDRSILYRGLLAVGLILVSVLYLLPSLLDPLPGWLGFVADKKVSLGLDLQGGTHLILSVDVDQAVRTYVEVNAEQLRRDLREDDVRSPRVRRTGDTVATVSVPEEFADKLRETLDERFQYFETISVKTEDGRVIRELALNADEIERIHQSAVEQSLETIRNRIDQLGVSEPVIQRQGQTDILVQLPGIQDPERAKTLIGRTAVLEFKLVRDPVGGPYTTGDKPLPAGTEVLYELVKGDLGKRSRGKPLLVESRILMTGDVITDARVRPGELPNSRVVSIDMNSRGARLFEEITSSSVNRQLAIILDNTVYSAPRINERIPGGRAIISGSFTAEEARDLAIVLRTGALPAPVEIAEERTVGPTLGADSIRQGVQSFVVGGVLVLIFMVFYYKVAGVLADLALVLNVVFLVAMLAGLGATLTLPGIAGIVLTLGMAVDANVLINERIREELRLGKTARSAVEAGYERALPAILDSNITSFLSGIILFQFGSGPIKGFAITLCIGLASSVFTAVVLTRLVYDYRLSRGTMETVSI